MDYTELLQTKKFKLIKVTSEYLGKTINNGYEVWKTKNNPNHSEWGLKGWTYTKLENAIKHIRDEENGTMS